MVLTPKLELRQGQALVMTPQLQQAIKLLQMSNLDLMAYVENELEQNPLLERAEDDAPDGERRADNPDREPPDREFDGVGEDGAGDDGAGEDGGAYGSDDLDGADGQEEWLHLSLDGSAGEVAANFDTEVENVFPEDAGAGGQQPDMEPAGTSWRTEGGGRGGSFERGDFDMESVLTGEITLRDHLTEQLALAIKDPAQRLIGQHLIDAVDEAGYLSGDLDSIAERLGASPEMVEEVLQVVQGFDPPGVFARNLAECLTIQLKEKDRFDPAMATFIENIELLARREFSKLKKLCGFDEEDFNEVLAEIRALEPKPGLKFGSVVVQPVVPDIFLRARPDGGWHVELNTDALPKVLVDKAYYTTVSRNARDEQEKTYISECMQNATWLVKSLDQRARTILKVATEIVRQQDAFFMHGVQHLRPLNLKMVADAISMHESTVSRVTSNKYLASPRGTFELKFFFTSAIAAADGGEAHSAEAVRHRIKALIDAEPPDAILSDDQIVRQLKDEGVDIARRTVAKYREAMHISSSVQRRREKRGPT